MRGLVLSWEYPPGLSGGLGRHVHEVSEALVAAGHEVIVVTRSHPDAPGDARCGGVRVVRAAPPADGEEAAWARDWMAAVLAGNAAMTATAHDVLASTEVDVVHAHDWMVGPAAMAVRGSRPLVATIHATERGRHQGWLPTAHSRVVDGVERALVGAADVVCTTSAAMDGEVTTHLRADAGKLRRVGNGIDVTRFAPGQPDAAVEAFGRGADARVVYAGRLEWEKGVHDLLAAVRAIRDTGRDVRAVIAGDGTQAGWLRAEVGRLGLDDAVAFLGFCDADRLIGAYAASDIAVVPSRYEPFGLAALEAMAAGIAVIATRAGGLAEIVTDGVTGLLVQPGVPEDLAARITSLVDDPTRRADLASAGRQAVGGSWAWRDVADAVAAAWADATTRRGGARKG